MSLFSKAPCFIWSANVEGLAVRFGDERQQDKARRLVGSDDIQTGHRRMQMLAECGEAEVRAVTAGIFLRAEDAVRLDVETREIFKLPPAWPGGMRLQTNSVPQLVGFVARLGLVDMTTGIVWDWKLRGPILEVGEANYLPTAAQFAALAAFQAWYSTTPKDELTHLSLLASLREAHTEGCLIDLAAYRDADGAIIVRADELLVDAREDAATGELILRPLLQGKFPEIQADEIEARLGQLGNEAKRAVIRVGRNIVLLDEVQTAQARAIKSRSRVPKSQRATYESDPALWLSDYVFPDVPIEFSPRVTGIGEWSGGYVGAALGEPQDWFGKQPEPQNTETEPTPDPSPPVPPKPETKPHVLHPLIIPNDIELGYGWDFPSLAEVAEMEYKLDFSRYTRQPLAHQKEAIRWLLAHARRALKARKIEPGQCGWGAGALLADDMGLGKTFSALAGIAEWFSHWRQSTNTEPPAALVVAPLSLLQNWEIEMAKAYLGLDDGLASELINDRARWCATVKKAHADGRFPFARVVLAHPGFDLQRFRRTPGARDEAEPGRVREFGLCFGDGSERSLDWPGSCVITTYQTLRDYRFSFAASEWSAAVFDEAQNIKNPNAQQTIAAKALRALFRIAMTGTPVENHLGDFWCILDTAEPGPLGAFADFRNRWIAPMLRERERMREIGRELRDHVGGLMLRRMKEDELPGLPTKTPKVVMCEMPAEQQALYEQARGTVAAAQEAGDDSAQGQHLAALWHLRQVSLHPDLVGGGRIAAGRTPAECRRVLLRSGKLAWLLQQLDLIKKQGEKVLVFCVLKQLQEALSRHLEMIYDIPVPIINGDTKATSRNAPEETRLGLIDEFSRRPGFAVCVLSPIAAGAGLNIVAANHVIHLERHWNPAKEDQATDRAYRIGQTKPVTVYLPSATHPDFDSFDLILHRLIENKRGLQGALGLIPPDTVSAPEIIAKVFGSVNEQEVGDVDIPITLDAALRLSWKMYEALIAVIFAREAERVILTPHGSDHGADVVVLGWGAAKENILIQCKTTINDTLDSEEGVRAVAGSQPFFERPLCVNFTVRMLHSTARQFGRRSRRAAEVCRVSLHGREWLDDALKRHQPSMRELLKREGFREKIVF